MSNGTYWLCGFGVGSLAGLLLAPRAGAATRASILKTTKKGEREVRRRLSATSAAIDRGITDAMRAARRMALPTNKPVLTSFRQLC